MPSIESSYKTNVLHHIRFPDNLWSLISSQRQSNEFRRTFKKIEKYAELNEHDLVFLYKALRLVYTSDLRKKDKTILLNALYKQLANYIIHFYETSNLIFGILNAATGWMGGVSFNLLNILYFERLQHNLEILFNKNKEISLVSILNCIFIETPSSIQFDSSFMERSKTVGLNVCEFLKTNLTFFHHKLASSQAQPLINQINQVIEDENALERNWLVL